MKRILAVLVSIFVLIMLGFFIFAFFFHTHIESQIAKQVTERTEGKLSFSESDLSIFNSFPSLSCRLTDIHIHTLAQAEHLDVHIGLLSAIMRKPVIKNATLRNATIELVKDEQGWNYQNLFETKTTTTNSPKINVALQDTYLENITVKMIDNDSLWAIGHIREAKMYVRLRDGITDLMLNGLVQFAAQDIDSTAYHQVRLDLKHTMDDDKNYVDIKDTYVDEAILLEGVYDLSNSGSDTELQIVINDLDVDDIAKYVPEKYLAKVSEIDGSINGTLLLDDSVLTSEDIEIEGNGESLFCKGIYDIHKNQLRDVSVNGSIDGSMIMLGLADSLQAKAKGDIHINALKIAVWNLDTETEGLPPVAADCTFDKFALSVQESDWLEVKRGDIKMQNDKIILDNIVTNLGKSSLLIHGSANIKSGKEIDLAIKSKYLDIAEIWDMAKTTGLIEESAEETSKPVFDLEGNVNVELEELVFEDATVTDIHGEVQLSYETIDFKAAGDAFSGSIEMDGVADLYEGLHIETDIIAKDVELDRCLIECQNFGQEFITADNMKGKLNSVGTYNFYWDDSFNYLSDETQVLLSAKVSEGELNNLDMMMNFSTFIKTKDLERIKFTSLQNYIEIDGKNLYIPTMFIQSNATNLTMNGIHSIDHQMLYNLEVNAGQVLMNKLKRHDPDLKPQPAQKGWFNLYYRITGKLDDFKYERNKRLVQASFRRELLRKEKIYQSLLDRFGYLETLKPPSDWSSIPEYNLN